MPSTGHPHALGDRVDDDVKGCRKQGSLSQVGKVTVHSAEDLSWIVEVAV